MTLLRALRPSAPCALLQQHVSNTVWRGHLEGETTEKLLPGDAERIAALIERSYKWQGKESTEAVVESFRSTM